MIGIASRPALPPPRPAGGAPPGAWKRVLDVAGAAVLLLAAAPVMAAVAGLVRWRLGRPVLFRQVRPGLHGAPFTIYKFRTMTNARDASGRLLPNEERRTRLGSVLRRWSLDELPELWNVLRGEMSLVGPRPLLMEYLPLYSAEQARRMEVRPGITGWAQVNGRNVSSWEERFAHDVWYVDHVSLGLDLRILARTGWKVLTAADVRPPGAFTTPRFRGTGKRPPRGTASRSTTAPSRSD